MKSILQNAISYLFMNCQILVMIDQARVFEFM